MSSVRKENIRKSVSNFDLKSVEELYNLIVEGDIAALGKAITLIESKDPKLSQKGRDILSMCKPSESAIRIGITGVPGVGKSTFIESFGEYLIESLGKKIAVLAIDPTSQKSGGSILGDKTRMENLAKSRKAFIRPSASGESLGGVTYTTKEAIALCEAAGFDVIIVETVGVGQSETAVHGIVDFFLLLMLAGAGDELQGIKRGIMEMADALVINKADGDNISKAKNAMSEYKSALHLFPPNENGWIPQVKTCSALENSGITEVWEIIEKFELQLKASGYWHKNRSEQDIQWLKNAIIKEMISDLERDQHYQEEFSNAMDSLRQGKENVFELFRDLSKRIKKA